MNFDPPIHPGAILDAEFLQPNGTTMHAFAEQLGVPYMAVWQIVTGHSVVTAGMALRLSAMLGTTPEFWLNMQMQYDLAIARKALEP